MKAKSWEYLAGIMDGEGCISILCSTHMKHSNGKYYPHFECGISIYQQDVRLMKWLVFHFGGQYYRHPMKTERKDGYSWHAPRGQKRIEFLLSLIPYLLLKQEQAKLALEYARLGREINPAKRRELAEKCSALNNRKSPTTNTSDTQFDWREVVLWSNSMKIESELMGDYESVPVVIQ